jgi:tRNA(fMet)-specific endonuclease VapC
MRRYLLDTDHLSVLERGGAESERLRQRLRAVSPDEVAATVVSYEEQTRGWLSYMARTQSLEEQVTAYNHFQRHLQVFCAVPLIAFDTAAAAIVQHL